jgi:predicted DNA-binding antitoxin AbrB/MazE fold protein
MTIKAIYENGVFRPQEPVHLAERTEVEVLIPVTTLPDIDDPTGWKAAEARPRTKPSRDTLRTP